MEKLTETINGVSFNMIPINGGSFMMGSPETEVGRKDDETQHEVKLSGFMIGETQVSQELWEAVMGNNPSRFKGENRPVENVNWDDTKLFCDRLSQRTGKPFRLPTEAEWEYACRAGTTTPFHTGNNLTTEQANYDGNYPYNGNPNGIHIGITTPVKSYAANAWGLYDMHGNVREWCNDWYGAYATDLQTNPTGAATGLYRLMRGGSSANYAAYCRAAYRSHNSPENRYGNIGLRLVY